MIVPRGEREGEMRRWRGRRRIGGRKVILREQPILPSGLPYQKVVEGARYGELPAKLRPTITFGLGADLFGDPLAKKTLPWPQLNNRKVTLSFKPATEADEATLQAMLPEGEITDLSQLPKSIPAYLIQVVPELKVDGETVLAGSPMRLGEDLAFSYSVSDPIFCTKRYPNQVVAGSFLAIAVIGGSVGVGSLEEVKAKLNETKEKLQSEDAALIAGLTREDLLGDMFHAGMLGYFAQYQALGHLSALSQKNHFQLATSAGTYGYVPNVTYFFGIPRSITPGGVEMDLDRVAIVTSVDGKGNEYGKNFTFQLGALSSALEHAVPEQMFVTPERPGEAVSAVKTLQKAAAQGQRIYHITQANQATALPNIRQSSLTMSEIRAALVVGKEVIVHTEPISVPGWKGAGYIVTDADTGAGAWKIGGGSNGSHTGADEGPLLTIIMGILVVSLVGMFVGLALLFLVHTLIAVALAIALIAASALAMMWVGEEVGYGIVFAGLALMAAILAAIVSAPAVAWVAAAEMILLLIAWILNVIYTTFTYAAIPDRRRVQVV